MYIIFLQDSDNNSLAGRTKSNAEERQKNVLLIAVAYAANIGGTGVITGSPPNLVILEVCCYFSTCGL
jgi:Na+/H+ antiporter NhaD/arsenite permease-like protein